MNAGPTLRMADLCARTGLNRQAIHFYVKEGLLPPGKKTSRNMAWYTQAHVDRILLIKRLQHERFLPLEAIRALLDEGEERFDPAQRDFLRQLRAALRVDRAAEEVDLEVAPAVDDLVSDGRVDRQDVERLAAAGLAGIGRDEAGAMRIRGEALPVVEVLAALRGLGFTEEQGFHAQDVLIYERAVSSMLSQEAALVARSMAGLPADEAARRISLALPLVHELIARLHRARIEDLLDAV
ncbi:MerR family transcriptional regulator [Myxococcota bacterium]|nr:MerR family transcriptional regulator [Myxococcota bacterium]